MTNAFEVTVNALREQGLNSDEILEELRKLFQNLQCEVQNDAITEDIEAKIKKQLNAIYMPCNKKGYDCCVQAIRIYKEKGGKIPVVKGIYPEVANIFGITPNSVERVIRKAIEITLERCPKEIIASNLNISPKKGRITNLEFIAIMAQKI